MQRSLQGSFDETQGFLDEAQDSFDSTNIRLF